MGKIKYERVSVRFNLEEELDRKVFEILKNENNKVNGAAQKYIKAAVLRYRHEEKYSILLRQIEEIKDLLTETKSDTIQTEGELEELPDGL